MRPSKPTEPDPTLVDGADPVGRTPAWRTLSDALLAGFCHELGGRASAFVSIAHLATRETVRTGFVLNEIERESERLARLASLLRVLPRHESLGPRAVSLTAAVQEALELARYHHGLRAIELSAELAPSLPAVRVDKNAFTQSLLILLAATARRALTLGHARLRVTATQEEADVVVRLDSVADAHQDWGLSSWMDAPPPVVDPVSLETVRERWARDQVSVQELEEGNGFELRLPRSTKG